MVLFKRSNIPVSSNRDAEKRLGLCQISVGTNSNQSGDVVFVHGLGGNAYSTWHPQERVSDEENSWLGWLAKERSDLGIWSFGYDAEAFAWKGATMPLFDQASNLLDFLEIRNLGKRPLIFITHSLGGLLVKAMLRTAQTFNQADSKRSIVEQTKGIIFLATPHTGSHLANLVNNIGTLARTSVSVEELKAHDPHLRELNEWYRENIRQMRIVTKVYYEMRSVHGILVVDPDSANPGIEGVKPVAVPEDHISIAKPKSVESQVYLGTRHFIQEYLRTPEDRAPQKDKNTSVQTRKPPRLEQERDELQEQYHLLSEEIQYLRKSERTNDLSPRERFYLIKEIEESEAELEQLSQRSERALSSE